MNTIFLFVNKSQKQHFSGFLLAKHYLGLSGLAMSIISFIQFYVCSLLVCVHLKLCFYNFLIERVQARLSICKLSFLKFSLLLVTFYCV